jgi:hypothetical protein
MKSKKKANDEDEFNLSNTHVAHVTRSEDEVTGLTDGVVLEGALGDAGDG